MHTLGVLLLRLGETPPPAEEVKAGWVAFAIFLLLAAAVVLLCLSFVKQLRKAQAAKDAGAYGDRPADRGPDETGDAPGDTPGDRPDRP